MKKKSVAGIIIINFFKTLGIFALFVAVGVLSYYLTMLYYRQTAQTERSTAYTHVITVNTGNESSNLIYSYDKKKHCNHRRCRFYWQPRSPSVCK